MTQRAALLNLQGVGSDLLVREPGLPENLDIIPHVPCIGVTSSRTAMHLVSALAHVRTTSLVGTPLASLLEGVGVCQGCIGKLSCQA